MCNIRIGMESTICFGPTPGPCAWLVASLFARMGKRKRLPCAQAWSTSGLTGRLLRHAPHGHVGQISPDKDVNCCYTTAAFTLSPEPRASLCCLPVRSHADRCQLARRLGLPPSLLELRRDKCMPGFSQTRRSFSGDGLRTPPHGGALAFG